MGLLDIVRTGVNIARQQTADLQASVSYESWLRTEGDGTRVFDTPRSVPALVTRRQKLVKTASGEMVMSQASIAFLDPAIVVNELDRITLPDGTTGPILNSDGFVDRGTGHPILTEVYLG